MAKKKEVPIKATPSRVNMQYMPQTAADFAGIDPEDAKWVGEGETKEEKIREFANNVLRPGGGINMEGWRKVGQQFIGPILIRLKYEGIARDILLERPLPQGKAPFFPVKSDIGCAYVLQHIGGEPKVSRVEGKLVSVPLFRISSRPMVPKCDVMRMDFDIIGMIKEDVALQIMEKEDKLAVQLIDSAISNQNKNEKKNRHIVRGNPKEFKSQSILHEAFKRIARKRLKAQIIVMDAGSYYDTFEWTTSSLGWKAKEELSDGGLSSKFGDVNIKTCTNIDQNVKYVLPQNKYVGFMPISWSLDSTPLDHPENAEIGFVFDEEVGMIVSNYNGLVKLTEREYNRVEKVQRFLGRAHQGARYAFTGNIDTRIWK